MISFKLLQQMLQSISADTHFVDVNLELFYLATHTKKVQIDSSKQYKVFIPCMPAFTTPRKLENGKVCDIFTQNRVTEFIESEKKNNFPNAHKNNSDWKSKSHTSTQEAVDEQFKNYITPLSKQLEDLTRLIKGFRMLISWIFRQLWVPILVLTLLVRRLTSINKWTNGAALTVTVS